MHCADLLREVRAGQGAREEIRAHAGVRGKGFMYLIVIIIAALTTRAITPLVERMAVRLRMEDRPEDRKIHETAMPLLGGLGVAGGFAAGCLFAYVFPGARAFETPLLGLAVGAFMMLCLGIYDDRWGADAKIKLSIQILAAMVVVASGSRIGILTNPFGGHWDLGLLSIPVSIFWIVGITNAINLIDGLDGLAAGIGAIVCLTLFSVAIPDPLSFVPVAAIALAGACLGFLRFNFPPARIFLGDTGSLFIGFVIAVIGMQGFLKGATALALVVPILAVGVPVVDTALAILRRTFQRRHLFKADREHLHHRLVRIGLTQRQAVVVMYWVSIFLALTAVSLRDLPPQKGFLLLAVALLSGALMLKALGYVEARFKRLYERLSRLSREKRAPGPEEMMLLNGFHAQDEKIAAETAVCAAPSGSEDQPEVPPAAEGVTVSLAELIGRPGTPRAILERILQQRVRTP